MIDEKKISQATEKYLEEEGYKPYIEQAFKDGAEWAQEEFVKSLWHDASEKPELYNKWIIIKYDNYDYVGTHQVRKYGDWVNMTKSWPSFRWAYLDDILPKEL